jgi:trehalose 6-phosphate synthase
VNRRSQLVIVSNRLPVHRVKRGSSSTWQISPGGLVSALTPILKERPSIWLGWAGITGAVPAPFEHEGILNHPVPLSRQELEDYYEGFCNRTIWPLYHDAVRTPEFHRRWWWPYVEVNRRFAEAVAGVVVDGGMVWVHDYHLQLVPAMLRSLRPDVRIGFFLHIPFPPQELYAQLPWRRQILEGLAGADTVGFQTALGAQNFSRLAARYQVAVGSRGQLQVGDRRIRVGAFPISIDTARFRELADSEEVARRTGLFRSSLGMSRQVMLGVDRLDYTKGIDKRLRAFHELLRSGRVDPAECVLVQLAVPSRERVLQYKDLKSGVERLVGEINGEFGEVGRAPVHYLHRNLPVDQLVALYRAASVMIVTPLRDGMNLVAKEYVACRLDNSGVLVLSEFTGAAHELRSAVLVNPHDTDGLTGALENAMRMPADEQRRRMRALRRVVERRDVYAWARSFFEDMRQ